MCMAGPKLCRRRSPGRSPPPACPRSARCTNTFCSAPTGVSTITTRARSVGSSRCRSSASGSPFRNQNPDLPSSIASRPAQTSDTTTGVPMALASLTVRPWTSYHSDGKTSARAAHHRPRLLGRLPAEDTRLRIPSDQLLPDRAVANKRRDDTGAASGFGKQERTLFPGDAPDKQKVTARGLRFGAQPACFDRIGDPMDAGAPSSLTWGASGQGVRFIRA
jgi:hypothetical protein